MNEIETALHLFGQGFSCSQAVFGAFAGDLGLAPEAALKVSDGFGGGLGRQGMTCGALTGAVMVLGLRHGRTEASDFESKKRTVEVVRAFTTRFEDEFGSTACAELLGFDLSGEEMKPGSHGTDPRFARCAEFVRFAASLLSGSDLKTKF